MRYLQYLFPFVVVLTISLVHQSPARADSLRFLFGTPVPLFDPPNLHGTDLWNMVTPDGLQTYFTSTRDGGKWNLYVASRPNTLGLFGEPIRLANVNSPEWRTTSPSISADGLELYFDSDRPTPGNGNPEKIYHVWFATRPNTSVDFSEPRHVAELDVVGTEVGSPSLSADGLSLYYIAEPPNSIYVTTRPSRSDPWGPALDIGPLVNTRHSNLDPETRISADSLSLFFTLSGDSLGRSEHDMYVSTRRSTSEPWGAAVNLGDAVNGSWQNMRENEFAYLDAEHSTLYFTNLPVENSVRNYDLWQAPVLPFESVPLPAKGANYNQNFDGLGINSTQDGAPLPSGWTFTANDTVFNNATTRSFPATTKSYAGVYNAGPAGAADRSLVTDVTKSEAGELDFRTRVSDADLQALRLGFDIEAWQLRSGLGADPGEAAFHVVLEADSGNGFQQVADLGEFSTGKTLARPATGNLVDGNDPAYRRSFDTGPVDLDVPAGATLRTRWMGTKGSINVVFGLDNVSLRFAGVAGDANIDGLFNSADLVQVFQRGEYEDALAGNSQWSDGDWNHDHEFDSGDLVVAFQAGIYEQAGAATSSVPEPTTLVLTLIGAIVLAAGRRKTE